MSHIWTGSGQVVVLCYEIDIVQNQYCSNFDEVVWENYKLIKQSKTGTFLFF